MQDKDVIECEFYYTYDDIKNYESECTFPLSEFKNCADNNCVFKQLHKSQQDLKELREKTKLK